MGCPQCAQISLAAVVPGVVVQAPGDAKHAYRVRFPDGYEATLAMNFLGPFTLTYELLGLLQGNAPARCINVVSAAFKMWKPDPFQDLHSTRRFISGDAYERAKLLNVLFSLALARRVPAEQVTVNLVHPGLSWTQMTQSMTSQTIPSLRLVWPLVRLVQRRRSPEKSGQRVAALVASPLAGAVTGQYFEAKPTPERLSGLELDPQYQRRAWQLGCELQAGAAQPSLVIAAGITVLLSGLSVVGTVKDAISTYYVTAAGRAAEIADRGDDGID